MKPQCLFTGAWTILLLLLAALPTIAFYSISNSPHLGKWKRMFIALAVVLASVYFISATVNVLFSLILGGPVLWTPNYLLLDPGIPGWRPLLFTVTFFGIATAAFTRGDPYPDKYNKWYIKASVGLAVPTVIGIFIIGHDICESVIPEVGGGKPFGVQLFVGPVASPLLDYFQTNTHLRYDEESKFTISGDLIYATSDRYLLQVPVCFTDANKPPKSTIRFMSTSIDKKVVEAIVYTGKRVNYGDPCVATKS